MPSLCYYFSHMTLLLLCIIIIITVIIILAATYALYVVPTEESFDRFYKRECKRQTNSVFLGHLAKKVIDMLTEREIRDYKFFKAVTMYSPDCLNEITFIGMFNVWFTNRKTCYAEVKNMVSRF